MGLFRQVAHEGHRSPRALSAHIGRDSGSMRPTEHSPGASDPGVLCCRSSGVTEGMRASGPAPCPRRCCRGVSGVPGQGFRGGFPKRPLVMDQELRREAVAEEAQLSPGSVGQTWAGLSACQGRADAAAGLGGSAQRVGTRGGLPALSPRCSCHFHLGSSTTVSPAPNLSIPDPICPLDMGSEATVCTGLF